MGRSLETRKKSIDANVEKDGAKEMRYKDSYDYLFEDDDIRRMDEIRALLDEEGLSIGSSDREMSEGMKKALAESEIVEDPLWDARTLGKTTINEPIQAKQGVDNEDRHMMPVDKTKISEFADELDPVDAEMQKKFEEAIAELEGVF